MDEIAKEYDVVVLGTGKYPACGVEAVPGGSDRIVAVAGR